jgi:hypothetical protein
VEVREARDGLEVRGVDELNVSHSATNVLLILTQTVSHPRSSHSPRTIRPTSRPPFDS